MGASVYKDAKSEQAVRPLRYARAHRHATLGTFGIPRPVSAFPVLSWACSRPWPRAISDHGEQRPLSGRDQLTRARGSLTLRWGACTCGEVALQERGQRSATWTGKNTLSRTQRSSGEADFHGDSDRGRVCRGPARSRLDRRRDPQGIRPSDSGGHPSVSRLRQRTTQNRANLSDTCVIGQALVRFAFETTQAGRRTSAGTLGGGHDGFHAKRIFLRLPDADPGQGSGRGLV